MHGPTNIKHVVYLFNDVLKSSDSMGRMTGRVLSNKL